MGAAAGPLLSAAAAAVTKHPEQVLLCVLARKDWCDQLYFTPRRLTDASFVFPVTASCAAVVAAAALRSTIRPTSHSSTDS